jgi:hypothetical protein
MTNLPAQGYQRLMLPNQSKKGENQSRVANDARLFRLYQRIHKRVHKFKKPHKVLYQISQLETVVGWVTTGFELYATFGPLESKANCIKACNEILKWVKNEESSLFMLTPPTW